MRIAFINPQGNFDDKDSHWTEHPDFGGQLVYVKEVALSMAKLGVKVDIITRKIVDKNWPEFAKEVEVYHGNENVRVIRIAFGGDLFLNKEDLWPYLQTDFADGIVKFYKAEGTKPDAITGHYGDGGLTASVLSKIWNVPYTFTAHSLGAQKKDKLVNETNAKDMEEKYHFKTRLAAERAAMLNSYVNIVSTAQERNEQYSHKEYSDVSNTENDNRFAVIPPGVNTEVFCADKKEYDEDIKEYVLKMFSRDLDKDRLEMPCVVLSSRLDDKKNHIGAVKAYAKSDELQNAANLVIVVRGVENAFEDYSFLKAAEIKILDSIMETIKKYNLQGKVTIFSINSQKDLGSLYRTLSSYGSVFCLTAHYEPFGLAPIEAMGAGLPGVVTKNGGPSEITDNGKYGVLVDPLEENDIANGLLKAVNNFEYYKKLGIQRVNEKYTWDSTAKMYLEVIKKGINR